MPDVTIVYWRDIPAQVIVGKGRSGAKRPLPERFEQAIDRAAMKVGAQDTDAYLAEWRKADPFEVPGTPEDVASAEAARLELAPDFGAGLQHRDTRRLGRLSQEPGGSQTRDAPAVDDDMSSGPVAGGHPSTLAHERGDARPCPDRDLPREPHGST